jgi:hypothetical protein
MVDDVRVKYAKWSWFAADIDDVSLPRSPVLLLSPLLLSASSQATISTTALFLMA